MAIGSRILLLVVPTVTVRNYYFNYQTANSIKDRLFQMLMAYRSPGTTWEFYCLMQMEIKSLIFMFVPVDMKMQITLLITRINYLSLMVKEILHLIVQLCL